MRPLLLLLAGAALTAAAAPAPAPKLAPFAEQLSTWPAIGGPGDWPEPSYSESLARLAAATSRSRQEARWHHALALLAQDRAPDALGVLDVMLAAEPDLALVPQFQLARGRVLAILRRPSESLGALNRPGLQGNSEACAWAVAAADESFPDAALRHLICALPAIAARSPGERSRFLLPAAKAALEAGRPDIALRWLRFLPSRDPEVMLVRGRALLAAGKTAEARRIFADAQHWPQGPLRAQARLGLMEAKLAARALAPEAAIRELDRLTCVWRGDGVERNALQLTYSLARQSGASAPALKAGAALMRYHLLGAQLPAVTADWQSLLASSLSADSKLPLASAAGLYWDYRDLAPRGARGDALANQLADRLQHEGLYARAAGLLEHQLRKRAGDVAQGPLSVRVARLHMLAGRPASALKAIRGTADVLYPSPMVHDRQRMEAVALFQLGRADEAVAVLEAVPNSSVLRAELLWKTRDWSGFAAYAGASLPRAGGLSDVRQAVLLRYAIALGMLGRERPLAILRGQYLAAFAALPTARAFDLLTRPAAELDPAAFAEAMAAIPSVSPAGRDGDLLDLAAAPRR